MFTRSSNTTPVLYHSAARYNRTAHKAEKKKAYGNIGRGVEQSIKRNDDMELKAVFTRRDPVSVSIQTEGAVVKHFDDMESMKDEIDVKQEIP